MIRSTLIWITAVLILVGLAAGTYFFGAYALVAFQNGGLSLYGLAFLAVALAQVAAAISVVVLARSLSGLRGRRRRP